MVVIAKKWVLARRPNGVPTLEDFKCVTEEIPDCKDGEVILESEHLTVDPYMRISIASLNIGDVIVGGTVGKVIQSKNAEYPLDTRMVCYCGWRSHYLLNKEYFQKKADAILLSDHKVFPEMGDYPLSTAIGVLGMTGMTAYFGLLDICDPQPGEVVLVNAAGGAVGSLVCQIAKIKGCKVIAFAGDESKISWLKQLGIDSTYNYKTTDVSDVLAREAPKGVNVYFENVGGEFSRKVMKHMASRGRISVCGAISSYNDTQEKQTPSPFDVKTIIFKQLKIEGFLVNRWVHSFGEAVKTMKTWLDEDKLHYKETVYKGFEKMPTAFIGLFSGENIGKAVVTV